MLKNLFCLIILTGFSFFNAEGQDISKWKIGDLEAYIKNSDKPTVVNFWATFCKPCIAEIPHFQKMVRQYEKDSVKLLLVSLDMKEMYPAKLNAFANKFNFTAPIVFLDETNADVFCPRVDEKWSGAIPSSLFINNKTGYRKFFEEEMSEIKFETELKSLIGEKPDKKAGFLFPVLLIAVISIILFVLFRNRRTAKS